MSTERLPDPADLIPEARSALAALTGAIAAELDERLLALCRLRAGQINGSAACVAGSARRARWLGATIEQVDAVAAWRETPWFTEAERAALALTESVTRLADHPDPVPDELWDRAAKHFDQRELAALLLTVAVANAVNRLNVSTRRQVAAESGPAD